MLAIECLLFIQSIWISSRREGKLAASPLPTSRVLCSVKGGLLCAQWAMGRRGWWSFIPMQISYLQVACEQEGSYVLKKTGSDSPLCSKFNMFRKNSLNFIKKILCYFWENLICSHLSFYTTSSRKYFPFIIWLC